MLDDGKTGDLSVKMLLMSTTGLRWVIYVLIRRDPVMMALFQAARTEGSA